MFADPVVLAFFFVYGAAVAPACIGSYWLRSSVKCGEALYRSLNAVTAFFWAYVLGGEVVLSFSWCVECGRHSTHTKGSGIDHVTASRLMITNQPFIYWPFFPRVPRGVQAAVPTQRAGGATIARAARAYPSCRRGQYSSTTSRSRPWCPESRWETAGTTPA